MKVIGVLGDRAGIRNAVVESVGERLGARYITTQQEIPSDTDILLNWRFKLSDSLETAVRNGCMMVCFDLGYFDECRLRSFSVSINGVHGLSMPVDVRDLPERPHPEIHPWREGGLVVQIMHPGHTGGVVRTAASNLPPNWVEKTTRAARVAFTAPVDIRYHPNRLPPGESRPAPLKDTYDDTMVSITYSSSSAVQTVLAGVPTIAYHPRCPAYDMCAHDMEIRTPKGREEWVHNLSYRNYDMLDKDELDAAVKYILLAKEQAQPLLDDLTVYGIRE
jgi:hypothetical protein